jgi:acyl-CoA reductase-like NAD-dependent aldehyde dehydrogenase
MEKKENLVNLMIYEGHPRQLAEREIASMILQLAPESLEYFTKGMIQSFGQQGKATLLTVRRPYGVMGVIAPRYASTLSFMACLALLAGNTLIINPSLQAPIACIYLWREILVKALTINQLPKGVVNIVADHSAPFMEAWLNSPYIHSILFFGDSQANLENGKKPILKLSGNDYLLVWKDAPLEPATESLLDGFMGSTQMCMIPKKALIHEDIFSPFVEMFLRKVKRIKPGLPSDPETILSPVTRIEDYFESLKDALEHGAKLLSGGYRMNHEGKIDPDGLFIAPTVLQVPFHQINSTKCMLHENFFPLLPLVKIPAQALTTQAKDRDIFNKMLQTIERHEPGLRTSVWIKDRLYLKKFLEQTQSSGFLRINSRHIDFSPLLCSRDQNEKSCSYYETLNHLWHRTSHLQWVNITHPNHLNN